MNSNAISNPILAVRLLRNTFRSWRIIAIAVVLATVILPVHAQCLSYGGKVQVTGTLERKTFPGPPEFESIAAGDAPETVWLLKLDAPVCVARDHKDESGINAGASSLKQVQLLLNADQYKLYAKWIGTRVTLRGKLFGAATAHHRTAVLLEQVEFGR